MAYASEGGADDEQGVESFALLDGVELPAVENVFSWNVREASPPGDAQLLRLGELHLGGVLDDHDPWPVVLVHHLDDAPELPVGLGSEVAHALAISQDSPGTAIAADDEDVDGSCRHLLGGDVEDVAVGLDVELPLHIGEGRVVGGTVGISV